MTRHILYKGRYFINPIKKISILSTGSVQIRPEHAKSSGFPLLWWLLTSNKWTLPRPINVYVIEHEQGLVLFDTGQDIDSLNDPNYFPKGFVGYLYKRLAKFTIHPKETLTLQMAKIGYDIKDVKKVVLSHLHQDHIGGLSELQHAEIIVSQQEWNNIHSTLAEVNGFLKNHIELPGLNWNRITLKPHDDDSIRPFNAKYDLFNDGSLVLVGTPGHTSGSMSLLIRQSETTPLLLVGDLTYDIQSLNEVRVPGIGKHSELVKSTLSVLELKKKYPQLVILAAHDPTSQAALHKATGTDNL